MTIVTRVRFWSYLKMWESIQRNTQFGIERRLEGHSLQSSYGRLIELYWNSVWGTGRGDLLNNINDRLPYQNRSQALIRVCHWISNYIDYLIQSELVLVCPPLLIQWNLLFRKNLWYKDDPQWEYLVVIYRWGFNLNHKEERSSPRRIEGD